MGLLDRLVTILSHGCLPEVARLCIRCVIACARAGPSSSSDIATHGILKLICDQWLQPSVARDNGCVLLTLRLLRTVCQASRGCCESLCSAGLVSLSKRFLVETDCLAGGTTEALRLWRVCLAYRLDTDAFLSIFPSLLLLPSMVNALHCTDPKPGPVFVDVVNVLQVLCACRHVRSASLLFDNVCDRVVCIDLA
jgi:hypothetical protein